MTKQVNNCNYNSYHFTLICLLSLSRNQDIECICCKVNKVCFKSSHLHLFLFLFFNYNNTFTILFHQLEVNQMITSI